MALPAEKERFTFADVLTWDENERIEIIDGEAVMMAPPTVRHQRISREIFRQLANYLEGKKCEVFAAPFGVRKTETDWKMLTRWLNLTFPWYATRTSSIRTAARVRRIW